MQNKRLILIVVGVILALVVAYLVKVYLDQQRQAAQEEVRREAAQMQANQTAVLVAKQDIPKGVVIAPEMLETQIMPNQYRAPQSVTSLDRIGGMVTLAPVTKGEQITLSKLAFPRQARGSLADVTPVGKRAITINVDNLSTQSGMVKAGDYVDLIVLLAVPVSTPDGKQVSQLTTIPLLQNVLVLALGQEIGIPAVNEEDERYEAEGKEAAKQAPSTITLALAPQEANLVTFIQEQGKIRLVLRSPADSQIPQLQMVTPSNLVMFLQHLLPKEQREQVEAKEIETKPTAFVEIFRGLKREKVPYSE